MASAVVQSEGHAFAVQEMVESYSFEVVRAASDAFEAHFA